MLDPALHRLESSGLIRRAGTVDLEYLFLHALVQDAAYASLLRTDRRRLHRAVAETLEALGPEPTAEAAATLAHHFLEAEDPRALEYFSLAGSRARAVFANTEAAAYFRTALALDPP